MLKLYTNGAHFKTNLSHYFNHLFQYSTSTKKPPSNMVDFLVKSLGFSPQEATKTWSKVRSLNPKISNPNPILVLDFFKSKGLNNTQIKKVISSMPQLLYCNIDKTLIPRFNALHELGIFGSDLAHIIASNASIFKRGMNTKIIPMISFIKSLVGDNDKFVTVLRRSYWLMSADVATRIQPNMDLLRKYGLSNERILSLLQFNGEIFGHNPRKLEEYMIKVVEDLKIPVDSSVFCSAVVLWASLSEETRRSKYNVFKTFGWSDFDILTMLRKSPRCLILSEANIRDRLEFFMNGIGCDSSYLANCSYVLTYSMTERVLPRYALLKGLKEKKVLTDEVGILTAVCSSEPIFLKKYVLPYMDEFPLLCDAYISRDKLISGPPMRS